MRYRDVHELSVSNPRFFWRQKMKLINWIEEPSEVLEQDAQGFYRWYPGGVLNTCQLALQDHRGHHVQHALERQVADDGREARRPVGVLGEAARDSVSWG